MFNSPATVNVAPLWFWGVHAPQKLLHRVRMVMLINSDAATLKDEFVLIVGLVKASLPVERAPRSDSCAASTL